MKRSALEAACLRIDDRLRHLMTGDVGLFGFRVSPPELAKLAAIRAFRLNLSGPDCDLVREYLDGVEETAGSYKFDKEE